jgi:hypothetical protein
MNLTLRRGKAADAGICGVICYEAFKSISQAHNFPPDIPSPEVASGFLGWMLSHPHFYAVVAEVDGRIVGSNFLDERNSIYGIGPITVEPTMQDSSVGRLRACDSSLYAKLGFEVREPLACMQATAIGLKLPGRQVRAATPSRPRSLHRVCLQVHGHQRGGELSDAIGQGTATVVEHDGRITATRPS